MVLRLKEFLILNIWAYFSARTWDGTQFLIHFTGKSSLVFYAFSKFKSFNPSEDQCFKFIQFLVLPILLYKSEMFFNSCTEGERCMLLKPFERNAFNSDIRSLIDDRIFSTAVKFYNDSEHVLNHCYQSGRKYFTSAKCRTTLFLNSFIPYSICLLNERAVLPL